MSDQPWKEDEAKALALAPDRFGKTPKDDLKLKSSLQKHYTASDIAEALAVLSNYVPFPAVRSCLEVSRARRLLKELHSLKKAIGEADSQLEKARSKSWSRSLVKSIIKVNEKRDGLYKKYFRAVFGVISLDKSLPMTFKQTEGES